MFIKFFKKRLNLFLYLNQIINFNNKLLLYLINLNFLLLALTRFKKKELRNLTFGLF